MKKKVIFIILILLLLTGCNTNKKNIVKNISKKSIVKNNLVSYNGNLSLSGINLVNQYGEKIQLRGMSSHGLQWYNSFINKENLLYMRDNWHSNVIRLAMYTKEGGYLDNKNIINSLEEDINIAIKTNMYVIVDWHILSDGNPSINTDEAINFFATISKKYQDTPNIIYEICNEPNGNITWNNDILPYANKVVSKIRENSKNSIIIVGTPMWDQDVMAPLDNKVNDSKVMYAAHFYAGTHTDDLRQKIKTAMDSGIPIFISEWGSSKADGSNGIYLDESEKWVEFMKQNNISWTNWSLSNKDESSALLKTTSSFKFSDSDLTEEGVFVRNSIMGK